MRVRVCFHNRCFDGACSAAVFTRFYQSAVTPQAEFHYRGLIHRAGQLFEESCFDGDENAIVDFKYSSSPRLTWWFDHHQSAFLTPADAEHFRRDRSGRKFFGPEFLSCTKFISHIGATRFNFQAPDLNELVYWADLIDGAQYADPKVAVEMRDAATQIALVIESTADPAFLPRLIPVLATKPLAEIASLTGIRQSFERLYTQHLRTIDIIQRKAELRGGVVFVDVSDQDFEGFNKFIPYYLFPEAVYSVALSRSDERVKIAVGSNPWNPTPKNANLASICERFGGGGHAKVAAISLPPDELDRGRSVAISITRQLRAELE